MQEHTVKAFDEDITRLRGLIAEMGGLAEVAIQRSLEALVKGDDTLAKQVIKGDKRIDALESEIDKLAIRVIALRAPMADDLREVFSVGGHVACVRLRVPAGTVQQEKGRPISSFHGAGYNAASVVVGLFDIHAQQLSPNTHVPSSGDNRCKRSCLGRPVNGCHAQN